MALDEAGEVDETSCCSMHPELGAQNICALYPEALLRVLIRGPQERRQQCGAGRRVCGRKLAT